LLIPGNEHVKAVSARLAELHLDIRPILYPTVPEGGERLRIALHSFNSRAEVQDLMTGLYR
jgi:8-amino-7-oxononanoate synthase